MKRLLALVLLSGFQLVLLAGCQLASANDTKLDEAKALLDVTRARQSMKQVAEQFSALGTPNTLSSTEFHHRIYNEMARIYSEVYTKAELRNIRIFFEGSVGQAFLDKKPNSLQFLSGCQLANGNDARTNEAKALFDVIRARQTMTQVAEQFSVNSDASTPKLSQDFNDCLYKGMVRTYSQTYTIAELREMRDFYMSPAGQAFLDKKPLLTKKYLQLVQNLLTEMKTR